jgi:hypothetical protein
VENCHWDGARVSQIISEPKNSSSHSSGDLEARNIIGWVHAQGRARGPTILRYYDKLLLIDDISERSSKNHYRRINESLKTV